MRRFVHATSLGLLWVSLNLVANQVAAQHDYKVSRTLIRAGKHQQALKVLDQRIANFSKDSEWVYQKAIALGQLGRVPEAMSHLQRSLAMGVPTGRVAADSHDLLKPLAAKKSFQAIVKQHANQPVQGPMVGSVTDSTASIWLRTATAATVEVGLTGTDNKNSRWRGETTAATDFTTRITVGPLASDTEYQYSLHVNGKPVSLPYASRFRTWPKQGSGVKFRFAFGGGAGYVTGHEHMWDTIGKSQPSVLFMLELLAACVALVVLFADTLDLLIPGVGVNEWKILCGILLIPLNFAPLRLLSFSSVVGIFSCFCSKSIPLICCHKRPDILLGINH